MRLKLHIFLIFLISFSVSSHKVNAKELDEDYKIFTLENNINPDEVNDFIKNQNLELDSLFIPETNLMSIQKSTENISKIEIFRKKFNTKIKREVNYLRKVDPSRSQNINNKFKYFKDKNLKNRQFNPYNDYLFKITNNFKSYSYSKGQGIRIGLIDTGVDVSHPNLVKNISLNNAKNYVDSKNRNVTDDVGHGTGVAGIIQILAPKTKITPYKVADTAGGNSLWTIQAIIDAVNDKNDVLNISIGTYLSQNETDKILLEAYKKAIDYAVKKNVIIVASSGNDGLNLNDYEDYGYTHMPGGDKNVITVSSNTNSNTIAPYSNFGEEIDYSATGGSSYDLNYVDTPEDLIITTSPFNKTPSLVDQLKNIPSGYTLTEGTSFSVPQVSAAIALIMSQKNKNITRQEIEDILNRGAIDIGNPGKDIYFGNGKINIYNSIIK